MALSWAKPVAGPTIWNSLPDNVIPAPSLSTSRQHLKTFLFQASSVTLLLIPIKLFPTASGSWSDFITWTSLKIHDWLIDWNSLNKLRPSTLGLAHCFIAFTAEINHVLIFCYVILHHFHYIIPNPLLGYLTVEICWYSYSSLKVIEIKQTFRFGHVLFL